jgi:hypothetical protein
MNWREIFSQSKVNGALYLGDFLPQQNWKWPKNTWLKQRLKELREESKDSDQPFSFEQVL